MTTEAVRLEIEPTDTGRMAWLFLPTCLRLRVAKADDRPRGGPVTAPLVNIAATVLMFHLRDCGCAATADLERRYAPMAARIREHGGWNSYGD